MLAKKLKTELVGAGVLGAALFAASAALAGPIALPSGEGLNVQLNGVTQINPGNNDTCAACGGGVVPANNGTQSAAVGGEGNWGVFIINNIAPAVPLVPNSELSQSGAPFWNNGGGPGSPGPQILAVLYGVQNAVFGVPSTAVDGVIDLYYWDANTQSDANTSLNGGIGLRNNVSQTGAIGSGYTGYSCAPGTPGCTFLAEFDLVPENAPGGGAATFYDASDPTHFAGATYFESEVDLTKGGAWAASLAADYFTLNNPALGSLAMVDPSDVNGVSDTRPCFAGECGPGWTGQPGVTVRDSDPVQFFTRVPEPGTLSLFGMGLLGLGFMAKRRNSKESKA